jgi:hypothetical protein
MDKEIIPKQLDIIILTSIPGYQEINYTPSMTIQNTSDKTVKFNPLYKLNKDILKKFTKENSAKQFVSKALFDSLLRSLRVRPATSLLEATDLGFVDNNINITLEGLFPAQSVIYINNQPYVICDVQWNYGDWRIKIEPKKVLTGPNYVEAPRPPPKPVKDLTASWFAAKPAPAAVQPPPAAVQPPPAPTPAPAPAPSPVPSPAEPKPKPTLREQANTLLAKLTTPVKKYTKQVLTADAKQVAPAAQPVAPAAQQAADSKPVAPAAQQAADAKTSAPPPVVQADTKQAPAPAPVEQMQTTTEQLIQYFKSPGFKKVVESLFSSKNLQNYDNTVDKLKSNKSNGLFDAVIQSIRIFDTAQSQVKTEEKSEIPSVTETSLDNIVKGYAQYGAIILHQNSLVYKTKAICNRLHIAIVTIEKYKDPEGNVSFRIPQSLNSFDANCGDYVMFIVKDGENYDYLTFDGKSIFKAKKNEIPPVYMLLLLFGSYYYNLTKDEQNNFPLYKDTMNQYSHTFKKPSQLIEQQFPLQLIVGQSGGGPTVISYEIKIEMQLFPGTTITPEQLKKMQCNAKYNSIWRNAAILTGSTYRPTPDYKLMSVPNNRYDQRLYPARYQSRPPYYGPYYKYYGGKHTKKKRNTNKKRKTNRRYS